MIDRRRVLSAVRTKLAIRGRRHFTHIARLDCAAPDRQLLALSQAAVVALCRSACVACSARRIGLTGNAARLQTRACHASEVVSSHRRRRQEARIRSARRRARHGGPTSASRLSTQRVPRVARQIAARVVLDRRRGAGAVLTKLAIRGRCHCTHVARLKRARRRRR